MDIQVPRGDFIKFGTSSLIDGCNDGCSVKADVNETLLQVQGKAYCKLNA